MNEYIKIVIIRIFSYIRLTWNLMKGEIAMAKCEKCGVEVPEEELCESQGLKVCEDCEIKGIKGPELKINL